MSHPLLLFGGSGRVDGKRFGRGANQPAIAQLCKRTIRTWVNSSTPSRWTPLALTSRVLQALQFDLLQRDDVLFVVLLLADHNIAIN